MSEAAICEYLFKMPMESRRNQSLGLKLVFRHQFFHDSSHDG